MPGLQAGKLPDTSLIPDCDRCCGLCCVAPGFSVSPDFSIDKPAGRPCPNLTGEFRCTIHDALASAGFAGCVSYDCYGSGQKVMQHTFGGQDWRQTPAIEDAMFAVFMVMRRLHELLMLLTEALKLELSGPLREELKRQFRAVEATTLERADAVLSADVAARKKVVDALLLRVGDEVRAASVDRE